MPQWWIDNKDWLFSGALVALPIAIVTWFLMWLFSKKKKNVQKQKGGHGSTNIQVGGDFTMNEDRNDD